LVSLHALESGGTQLTRSSWYGSRIYYSGGAVATFNVYNGEGHFLCSGVSYAYRGFVQATDIGAAALFGQPKPNAVSQTLPPVSNIESDCSHGEKTP
jgi:hypothetical protein